MARIAAFKGYRYQDAASKNMQKRICPPYDVIAPAVQKQLMHRDPCNIVRLELPVAARGYSPYQTAKRTWLLWREKKILVQDQKPALYVYEQRYRVQGRQYCRRGFFAAVRVEAPHRGSVKPHEKTLPKAKKDRLALLSSVQVNTSPIFSFFSDTSGVCRRIIAGVSRTRPVTDVADTAGVRHTLYLLDDAAGITRIQQQLGRKQVFIADGHHRYETAYTYCKRSGRKHPGARFVMMYLCPIEDPGLIVLPTHRIVYDHSAVMRRRIQGRLRQYFYCKAMPSAAALATHLPRVTHAHAIGYCSGNKHLLLLPKSLEPLHTKLRHCSRTFQELDVVLLHTLLLHDVDTRHIRFVKDAADAYTESKKPSVDAFFLNAPTVHDIRNVSMAGETMPQKTTFFYPKLATGMVLYSLEDSIV